MKIWLVIQKVDFINLGYIVVKAFNTEQGASYYKNSLINKTLYDVVEIKVSSEKQPKYNLSNDVLEDKNVTEFID
jgi:hypothetical protein